MNPIRPATIIGHALLLATILLALFVYRSFSREFYLSYFLYLGLIAGLVVLVVALLYRHIGHTASGAAKGSAGYFFRYGFTTTVLGLALGIGSVSVYSRQLDDYYPRRMAWEEQELNRYANLPAPVRQEILQDHQDFNDAGLEEWMLAMAGGLAALAASGGLIPFFLDHSRQK